MIAVIDYDIGNLGSVSNMLQRLGLKNCLTRCASDLRQASRIILPGNGSFDACSRALRETGLIPLLEERVLQHNVPLLGICVGAQMLGHWSAEGLEPGLGWLDFQVDRFPSLPGLRIPHMGWNHVNVSQADHPLLREMTADARFYFTHSYYLNTKNPSDVLLHSHYGIDFAAAVARGNIVGVQFHPEKSHRFGKQLLNAFANWAP